MSTDTNLTGLTGGDSLTQALEMNAQYNRGDMAWVLISAVLVWIMVPGIGLLYSGLARRHSSTALLWQSLVSIGVVSFQWFFWGYSLTFSHSGGPFIGDLTNFGSKEVLAAPSVGSVLVPDILFYIFQLMFACVTGMLMLGGAMERGRLMPSAVFLFIWTTIVYDPIAFWTWNSNGWLYKLGSLDFAGGGPVHQCSGAAALAYALVLGRRQDLGHGKKVPAHKPGNVFFAALGTIFLWFGWFGFNGGSTVNMTIRSVYACVNTNLAASCGALTWAIVDYFRKGKKWSIIGLCAGAIAGLVGITPAAGYVPVYTAVPIGVVTAIAANFAYDLKHFIGVDDGLDVFALHGVAGFVGNLMTGLFAADYVTALDGISTIPGGWINHHYVQLGYQLAGCVAILSYSFTVTFILLHIVNFIPGLKLRISEEDEHKGVDELDMGEMLMEYGIIDVLEMGKEQINKNRTSKLISEPPSVTDGEGATLEIPHKGAEKQV